jgi:hypothetical protein
MFQPEVQRGWQSPAILVRPICIFRDDSPGARYMRSIIACPKAEVEISCAPSISRARS